MKNKKINKNKKYNNYIFTIQNYTKANLKRMKEVGESCEKHVYMCYGLEIAPKTGTPHIQGYIQLRNGQRFHFIQKYFNLKQQGKFVKFTIKTAYGTLEQNQKYTKKEGKWFEYGEPKKQGKRVDIDDIKERLNSDPRNLKAVVKEDTTSLQQLKFAENFQGYCFEHRSIKNPPTVLWLYGASGVGKTLLVYKTFDESEICSVSYYKWLGSGYEQQECLLLDDFRAGKIDFDLLLKITDRYPLELAKKFGSAKLNSPFIIFTSPKSLTHTFSFSNENLTQLKRRITEINLDEVGVEIDLRKIADKVDK